jgi:hypothetical protein
MTNPDNHLTPPGSLPGSFPRRCTAAGFVNDATGCQGFDIRDLGPRVTLVVGTSHSRYDVTPVQSGDSRVVICGGRFFPQPTEARLAGSTFGGSLLRQGWIGIGMCLEIHSATGPFVTSRVRSITTVPVN